MDCYSENMNYKSANPECKQVVAHKKSTWTICDKNNKGHLQKNSIIIVHFVDKQLYNQYLQNTSKIKSIMKKDKYFFVI